MDKDNKVTFKKQLVRNAAKNNIGQTCVTKHCTPTIPPLRICKINSELESSRGRVRGIQQDRQKVKAGFSNTCHNTKKTTFSVPDDESLRLALGSNSENNLTNTNRSSKDTKRNNNSVKSSDLNIPKLQSSLNIGKQIDKIAKMKISSNRKTSEKTTFDEKVTRQMNFPHEQNIFKGLIPLSSPNKLTHTVLPSREPMVPKDKEPLLENFIEPKIIQEYSYVPNIRLESRKGRSHCNNLHLYKVLQTLEIN